VDIVHKQGRCIRQRFLPENVGWVDTVKVGRSDDEDVPFVSAKQRLTGGMEKQRSACGGIPRKKEGVEALSWTVHHRLAQACGVKVFFSDEPLLEGPLGRPR